MKNTEIFYFDVDGTILNNDDQTISESTIEALNKLKAAGYKLALSTGRTVGTVKDTDIQRLIDWDGYVLGNGGIVLDKDFNYIRNLVCDPSFIHELIEVYPDTIILEGAKIYMVGEYSEEMVDFLQKANVDIPKTIEYNDEEIHKIIINDVSLLDQGFHHPVFDGYDYHINTDDMFEIFPNDSGKEVGIDILNKHLNVKTFTYFGDGNNDVRAIEHATVGVAMGNAVDDAKDVSDYVTTSVGDDGIYNALKHFNII